MKNPPVANGIMKFITNRFEAVFQILSLVLFALRMLNPIPVNMDKIKTEAAITNKRITASSEIINSR